MRWRGGTFYDRLVSAPPSRGCVLVAAFSLTSTGCDRFGSGTEVTAPTLVLTRAEPTATYAVVLCLDGPDMGTVYPEAMVRGTGGLGVVAILGGSGDSRRPLLTGRDESQQFGFEIDSAGPWSDQDGLRCAPAQEVTFELPSDGEADATELQWSVSFRTEFSGLFIGIDDVRANENSVQIDRVRSAHSRRGPGP